MTILPGPVSLRLFRCYHLMEFDILLQWCANDKFFIIKATGHGRADLASPHA